MLYFNLTLLQLVDFLVYLFQFIVVRRPEILTAGRRSNLFQNGFVNLYGNILPENTDRLSSEQAVSTRTRQSLR